MNDPGAASLFITPIHGSSFITIGVLRLFTGLQLSPFSNNWFLIVLAALFTIAVGGMIIFQWPESSCRMIGQMVALELLSQGISYVMVGLAARPDKA